MTCPAAPASDTAGASPPGPAAATQPTSTAGTAQAARAAAEGQPGWLAGRAAEGYACDAAIVPVVTGTVDQAALAALAADVLAGLHSGLPDSRACHSRTGPTGLDGKGAHQNRCPCGHTPAPDHPRAPVHPAVLGRLHEILLRHAAAVLSGPGGLASFLRTRLTGGPFPSASLPLEAGTPTNLITGALRRAVTARDRHCAFPGCDTPPAACQVHHLRPKARGGPTKLGNLILLCTFHHLIAVHQWGWTLTLHADATITASSPGHSRTLHSHSPPNRAA